MQENCEFRQIVVSVNDVGQVCGAVVGSYLVVHVADLNSITLEQSSPLRAFSWRLHSVEIVGPLVLDL